MKKAAAVILSLLMTVLSFASCTSEKPVVLFMGVKSPAGTFDPQIAADITASVIVRNCFEGLMRKDENGEPQPAGAESLNISADGLTYTFSLRQDAKWHLTSNAKEQAGDKLPEDFDLSVTADDYVFALKRAVAPETASKSAYMFYNIAGAPEIMEGKSSPDKLGIKAIDRFTLEIKLSRPQSNFTDVLCEPAAMPCSKTFFDTCSGRYGTLIMFSLSNGPFYLSRFDEKSYRINRADDYTGNFRAVPDAVWLYCGDDANIRKNLENNEYSAAVIDQYSYEKLSVTKDMTVREDSNVLRGFIMNLSDEVLINENIRKALAAATDADAVAENAGRIPIKGLVPSTAASEGISSHPDPYSEEKALEYLKAGLKELEKDKLEISLLCETKYEETMRRLLQEWQRILGVNINFTVKTASIEEIEASVKNGSFQVAFCPIAARTDSAYEYFGSFISGTADNITGFRAEGLEEITALLYAGDEENYKKQYQAIENMLSSASFIIPVWEEKTYFICTEDVKGIKYFSGDDKIYFDSASNVK